MDELKKALIEIAGKNALGIKDDDIQNLCHAIDYFKLQIGISINDIDDSEDKDRMKLSLDEICNNTSDILNKDA